MVDPNTVNAALAAATAAPALAGLYHAVNSGFQQQKPGFREQVAKRIADKGLWGDAKGAAEALKYPESFVADIMADEKLQPKGGNAG